MDVVDNCVEMCTKMFIVTFLSENMSNLLTFTLCLLSSSPFFPLSPSFLLSFLFCSAVFPIVNTFLYKVIKSIFKNILKVHPGL